MVKSECCAHGRAEGQLCMLEFLQSWQPRSIAETSEVLQERGTIHSLTGDQYQIREKPRPRPQHCLSAPLLYTLLSLTSNVIGRSTPCSLFLLSAAFFLHLSPSKKKAERYEEQESIGSVPQMIRGRWAAVRRALGPESRVRSPSHVLTCNQISFHLRL